MNGTPSNSANNFHPPLVMPTVWKIVRLRSKGTQFSLQKQVADRWGDYLAYPLPGTEEWLTVAVIEYDENGERRDM